MKPSLFDRIKEFHDGTAVVEDPPNIVPLALADDAARFQRDKDQIDWFRQMEAIEVQELAIRFLSQPGHLALPVAGLTVPPMQSGAIDESARLLWDGVAATTLAEDGGAQDHAGESPLADDDIGPALEDEPTESALGAAAADDPEAYLSWLRNITGQLAPVPVSSQEFARWALLDRQSKRVSRHTAVKSLLAMRTSSSQELEPRTAQLGASWRQLESKVLRHNVPAALHWAHRHKGALPGGLAFAFALLGMRRAARAFEPARGWQFLTFAGWWMLQAVRRARVDYGTALRIPVHIDDRLALVKRAVGGYLPDETRRLSNIEILAELAAVSNRVWTSDEVERVRFLDRRQHLSDAAAPADTIRAIDNLFDESRWMPADVAPDGTCGGRLAVSGDQLIEAIEHRLANSRREARSRAVIYERLGLDGQAQRPTLEQLGLRYAVTRERIRQLETKEFAAIARTLGIARDNSDD